MKMKYKHSITLLNVYYHKIDYTVQKQMCYDSKYSI